jgi:hypothetical protein
MDRSALIVLPTHANCAEAVEDCLGHGIDSRAYPARLCKDIKVPCPTCNEEKGNSDCHKCFGNGWQQLWQNCWETEAREAEHLGLSVASTVCPTCEHKKSCQEYGYLNDVEHAKRAPVSIATHARAARSGLQQLGTGRAVSLIHENAIDVLRPSADLPKSDLTIAQSILEDVLHNPKWLNWFGSRFTHAGQQRRNGIYKFCILLANLVDWLIQQFETAQTTKRLVPPGTESRPLGIDKFLFDRTRESEKAFSGPAWRILLAIATGELHALGIIVNSPSKKGGGTKLQKNKSLKAIWANHPSQTATTWFCDATVSPERLSSLLGKEVHDKTPAGHLAFAKRTVQIPRDVTRTTSAKTVQNLIRGLLASQPQLERVGVICHRPHTEVIENLPQEFRSRIVKIAYFGSGEERSSNEWYKRCELIVILGTPRVQPASIRDFLFRVGDFDSAGRSPKWSETRWLGRTESCKEKRIKGRGYHDPEWRQAHRELVRSTIVQAVGRGRGIMPSGCEVIVVSTEECGLALSDRELFALSESEAAILRAVD